MKKTILKILSLVIAVILVISYTVCAFAAPSKPYVNDEMDVFTDEEEKELTEKVKEIREKYNFDVVLLTVKDLEGKTATEYADDYFDYNGFGINAGRDGILFMISENPRKWAISTSGYGIRAFTPVGQEYIMDRVLPHLKSDNYQKAFFEFVKLSDKFVKEAKTNKPYDNDHMPARPISTYVKWFLISAIIGFVISIFIANQKKAKLKSVVAKSEANDYLKKDSLKLTNKEDIYLNKFVSYQVIESKSSSSNSSGSDRHTSSSGRTHGGSSGSY